MNAMLKGSLYVVVAVVLAAYAYLLFTAANTVRDMPRVLDQRLAYEAEATRKELRAARTELTTIAEHHITAMRYDLLAEVAATRSQAIRELAQSLDGMHAQVTWTAAQADRRAATAIDRSDTHLSRAIDRWVNLADAYAAIPAKIEDKLEPWTDCKGNGACWQAQTTATLGAARVTFGEASRTMRTIREAMPEIAQNTKQASGNIAEVTKGGLFRTIWRAIW